MQLGSRSDTISMGTNVHVHFLELSMPHIDALLAEAPLGHCASMVTRILCDDDYDMWGWYICWCQGKDYGEI